MLSGSKYPGGEAPENRGRRREARPHLATNRSLASPVLKIWALCRFFLQPHPTPPSLACPTCPGSAGPVTPSSPIRGVGRRRSFAISPLPFHQTFSPFHRPSRSYTHLKQPTRYCLDFHPKPQWWLRSNSRFCGRRTTPGADKHWVFCLFALGQRGRAIVHACLPFLPFLREGGIQT